MTAEQKWIEEVLWKQHASGWKQRLKAAIISLLSIYLGWYQWAALVAVWNFFFGEQSQLIMESIKQWIILPDALVYALSYLSDVRSFAEDVQRG